MKYLLDTNACIRYINGRSPQIRAKLRTIPRSEIAVSAVTKAEMYYGSAKSQTPQQSLKKQLEFLKTVQSLPFDDMCAQEYGSLRAYLEK
jgi:tRNA(fMet)-specific endonuclease VapC